LCAIYNCASLFPAEVHSDLLGKYFSLGQGERFASGFFQDLGWDLSRTFILKPIVAVMPYITVYDLIPQARRTGESCFISSACQIFLFVREDEEVNQHVGSFLAHFEQV
jgi:hypothetical protein